MSDFRFIRNQDHQNQHMEAVLAGYKFENWLETRISTLMTFSNNFYDSILELMNEILSNIDDYNLVVKELVRTKLFSSDNE